MPQLAGSEVECLSIPIQLEKEQYTTEAGERKERVGFRIGGGIDQDPARCPYNYPDTGVYITHVEAESPAERAGLRQHDQILQVNGYDFTMVTHEKAVKYIKKFPTLNLLVTRKSL